MVRGHIVHATPQSVEQPKMLKVIFFLVRGHLALGKGPYPSPTGYVVHVSTRDMGGVVVRGPAQEAEICCIRADHGLCMGRAGLELSTVRPWALIHLWHRSRGMRGGGVLARRGQLVQAQVQPEVLASHTPLTMPQE